MTPGATADGAAQSRWLNPEVSELFHYGWTGRAGNGLQTRPGQDRDSADTAGN
jgi:hypothetical protein